MFTGFEESKKVETIKFGSEITFRANSTRPYFLYCDGFNSTGLCAMALGQTTWEKTINFDFEKAVFKILPFSGPGNFKYLNTVYSYLKGFAQERDRLGKKALDERKDEVSDLRQKFFDELATNIDSYEKMKNTPVSFNSGVFVLVHKASMKYLSLLDDEQDELVYHLVDYPNEGSFFTAAPCLKMQTQRTNYLYSGDLVTLINQQIHVNSNPKAWIGGDTSALEEEGPELVSLPAYANLEKHTPLKVSLYMDIETAEDQSVLKTGDVVWLNFSERPYYLEAQLPNSSLEGTLHWITNQLYARTTDQKAETTAGPSAGAEGGQAQHPDALIGTLMEKLFSKFRIGYRRIHEDNGTVGSSSGKEGSYITARTPKSEGLFKIETQSMVIGERVCWLTNYYRFKHVLSGRYLAIDPDSPDSNYLTLERLPTTNSLVSFMPIQSGSTVETASRYVFKDSYYQLRSLTKNWLRLPLRKLEAKQNQDRARSAQANSGRPSNDSSFNSGTPHSSSKPRSARSDLEAPKELDYGLANSTDIDTLRVNLAEVDHVKQMNFLMASYPIILNSLIVIGDLNSQLRSSWNQQKAFGQNLTNSASIFYKHFESMFPKLDTCLSGLIDYLLNQSPSNINMSEEFGSISATRQQTLLDLKIAKMVVILVDNLFPFLDELTNERRSRLQAFAFNLAANGDAGSDAVEAKDKMERLEELNFFKRIKLISKCLELIRLICYANQQAQLHLAASLPVLTRYVGFSPSASHTIREILKNNDSLLMEYSKIKKVSLFDPNQGSPRTLHPKSPASPQNQDSNVQSGAKGSFGQRAAQVGLNNALVSMAKGQQTGSQHLRKSGHHRHSAVEGNRGGFESPHSGIGSADDLMKSLEDNISRVGHEPGTQIKENFDFKFFKTIAQRMGLYPAYSQADVLSYFRYLSHTQHRGFFLNQNEIFAVMFRSNLATESLIQTSYAAAENELLVRYVNKEGDIFNERFPDLLRGKHSRKLAQFFKESLLLYSSLSLFRNDITGRYFRNKFPLQLLVKYARDDGLPDEFRAVFLRLMHALYLDREPRSHQPLPSLIHPEDKHIKLSSAERAFLSKEEIDLISKAAEATQTKQLPLSSLPKLSESKQELLIITRLKEVMIESIEARSKSLYTNPPEPGKFFNEFTWEMLKVLHSLIKFDCYDITDENQAEVCRANMALIERIIKCLTFPLEFDADYHSSLLSTTNKLAFRQNSKLRKGFNNAINLNAYNSSTVLAALDAHSGSAVFRKSLALRKIISLFSNKIYQAPERDFAHKGLNIAESVKIEICKIFDLLSNNREEQLLLNTLEFFRTEFSPQYPVYYRQIKAGQEAFVFRFMPDHCFEAGQDKPETTRPQQVWTYNKLPVFRSFDQITGRSFPEVLWVSFYFATTPELQGLLCKLLENTSSQQKRFLSHIQSTLLLKNAEELDVYKKLRLNLQELEAFKSVSQVWYMIIKKSLYEREYERALVAASTRLQELYQYLKVTKESNGQMFYLQQQLLRKLNTHVILLDFIKEGYVVFETMEEIAKDFTTAEDHFRIDVFDILCNFFRHCHLVIILFCDNNAENQLLIAEQVKLFLSNRYINFGPVAPTNDKGKGGSSLKFLTSDQVLDFLMDLIAFHGELPQVLRLFILMIETGGKSSVFVKRAIFQKILSKERLLQFKISGNYAQETHSEPYLGLPDLKLGLPLNLDPIIKNVETQVRYFSFETLRNRDEYELLMMKLLAACIDNRSGINTITKAFDLYSFEDMVGTANDRAKRLRDSNIDPEKEVSYLQYLEAGVNILYLYMTSFEKYFLKFIERSPPTIKGMFDHILQVLDGMTMESERALKSPSAFFFSLLRIAQKSMSAYLKTSEPGYLMDQTAGFFSQFCNKVISELETRISKEVTEEEILLLKQVVRTMQLSLPQILEGAIQDYNERKGIINQQQRNDILNTSMVDVISSAITLKGSRSSDKGILKENTLGRKTIGNKYKEILMASEKEELNSSKQQLMNQDKLTETSDTSYIHGGDLADLPNDEKWGFFQRFLSNSSLVKAELVTEQKTLTNTLINFVMAYSDDDPNEMMIFCEDLVSKVVELLEFWQQRRIGKHSALFLVRILSNILRATSTPLEKSRIQIMMNSYGLMRILISIFVQEQDNDIMFLSEMIKLGGFLLEGGNRTIQDAIFKFFTRDPLTSEQFFSKVSGFLRKHALFLQTLKGDSEEPSLDNHYFPIQILELIRLFCENHHTEMQNYIRHQEGAKNQHDIVECTIQLLISCKVSPFTRPTIEKIFETLTEFAQGPCRENQIRIATSGFLEYAASLLKRDPKHRMHHSGTQPPAEGQPSPQRRLARQQTLGLSNFKRNVSAGAKTLNEKASGKDSKTKGAMGGDYFIQGIVEKLRYKCLTTTMALLEKLEPESIVVERIRKTIPVWVIKENLIQIYQKYQIRFGSKYVDSAFRKYDSPDADASCVIENGFFVYLLASVMIESIKPEEEERYSKIMAFKLELEACDRGENTMKRLFGKLGSSLKDTFDKTASALRLGEDSKAPADEKKLTQQALKFFKSKIIHIEIVRDAKLERVSFPKLPACFNLPKRTRALFTEEVDRKSITTKLINLSEAVPFFLRVMEHETRLSEVADAFGVLGYLLYHQINWLIWVMYFLGVVINGILLFVYNSAEDDGENVTGRIVYIIFVLGMIDLGLSLYITVMMSIRNIPVMLKELITEAAAAPPTVVDPNTSLSTFNRVWTKVYSVLRAIMNVLYRLSQDETSYYLLFVLSNFTGLFYDLLAYIFQLSFVVKLDLLKNVVSALWIRKTQLTLTFLLLILIFYYYAIIGYQFFPEDFPLKRCDQLFDCLIVTFDLTFKDGGGIGVFLTNIWTVYSNDSRAKFYTRFFYDLSLAMILVNVMLNIVTGIIIDEFGSLKDSMNERLEDTFNTCFACGFARDVFERNNVDFEKHVRQDHYQWNYVYFIAYLMRKKKTDLTGTESYVMDLYRDHDFTWFPIKKARGIKDDEEEQTQRYNQVSALESAMKGLKDEFDFVLDKTNRMYEDLLLEKQ